MTGGVGTAAAGARHRRLLAYLGIASFADLCESGERAKRFLPRLRAVAEAIIAAHPEVEHGAVASP